MEKKKVMTTIYNSNSYGGPTVSTRSVMDSFLSNTYSFKELIIDERLGILFRFSVVKRLVREIKYYNPDVLYVSGLQLHGFYVMLASVFAGYHRKTIVVVHGSACDSLTISPFRKFIFRYFIEPFTVRWAGCTYTVCAAMAKNPIIVKNCKCFGGIIHNAAPVINKPIEGGGLRLELGLSSDDVLLVYTGRVVLDKGIDFLIRAMPMVGRNIYLAIIGDGSDLDELKRITSSELKLENVFFLGRRNDVVSILFGCDIYVFPSLHENLPNSLLEACASGLPVIATDVGGNSEIIRDGENGILVPPKNSERIADAISVLSSNPTLRKRMGKKAIQIVQTEFSKEMIYPKIDSLFQEIISKSNSK